MRQLDYLTNQVFRIWIAVMTIFGIDFSTSDLWLLGIGGAIAIALVIHRLPITLRKAGYAWY